MRYGKQTTAGMVCAALVAAPASADESHARELLRGMSDYIGGLDAFAFSYDSMLDVVTTGHQKLGIAASGEVFMHRPDRLRATRKAGFSDLEMVFDGDELSIAEHAAGVFAVLKIAGSVDVLIDDLRDTYGRPVPAADLLGTDAFELLMRDVIDVKDMGSGVIDNRECDHLAFRTPTVDWQIWIAQGAAPFPCRFTITAKSVAQGPQYSIEIREWRTGSDPADTDFEFVPPGALSEVAFEDSAEAFRDLPGHYQTGETR